jgi:peptidoglycan/LPS O-acetylase OafA/YrhL
MTQRPELRGLTSLRGLAAWFVVVFHIRKSVDGLSPDALLVLGKGYLAVDFFFLLSGFVMALTWSDRLRTQGWATVPGFLRKRLARIWPLHLFILGCAVVLAVLLVLTGHGDAQFPFSALPAHVFLVQAWGFEHALKWNDPAWSISAEFAAYLFFPAMVRVIDWRAVPSWGIAAAILATAGLLSWAMAQAGTYSLSGEMIHFALLRCLAEFSIGTAVWALWERWRAAPRLPAALAALTGLALLAAAILLGVPETLACPLAFAALLLAFALAEGPRNPLGTPLLHYLGMISFATYLSHMLLWKVFKLALVGGEGRIGWATAALFLATVLAASVALYHLVEKPAQRRVNALRLASGTKRMAAH